MHKFFLELLESCVTIAIKVPRGIFVGKVGERYSDFGVSENESVVEVHKAKEGLNIFYFAGFQPIEDGLDFLL
jgi:hypothetical protein